MFVGGKIPLPQQYEEKKTKLRKLLTCFILQMSHFWILTVHYTNLYNSLPEALTKLQASEKR